MKSTIITMRQAAQLLGCNLGSIVLIRAKGGKLFDPTFPAMADGNFNQADILAWQAAKANKTAVATNSGHLTGQVNAA